MSSVLKRESPSSCRQESGNRKKHQTCGVKSLHSTVLRKYRNKLQSNESVHILLNKLFDTSLNTNMTANISSENTKQNIQTKLMTSSGLNGRCTKQSISTELVNKSKQILETSRSVPINKSFSKIPLKLKNEQNVMQSENIVRKSTKKEAGSDLTSAKSKLIANFHKDKSTTSNTIKKLKKEVKNIPLKSVNKVDSLKINSRIPNTNTPNCISIEKNNKDQNEVKKGNNIKIVINVHYNTSNKTSNVKEVKKFTVKENTDFDFLDEFDVDEIVESLYSCKNSIASCDNFKDKCPNDGENKIKCDKRKQSGTQIKMENDYKKQKLVTTTTHGENKKNLFKKDKHKIRNILSQLPDNLLTKSSGAKSLVHQKEVSVINNTNKEIENNDKTKSFSPKFCILKEAKINVKKGTAKSMTSKINNFNSVKLQKEITKENKKSKINGTHQKLKTEKDDNTNKEIKIKQECLSDEYALHSDSNESKLNEILVETLEAKMLHILMQKYSVTSVIHCGKFSKIFKCSNFATGKFYAVKILDYYDSSKGKKSAKMLNDIQKDIPRENFSCIFLKTSFQLDGYWCFMSHYYPINLQQFLHNKKCLDIGDICKLGMQLVQAVFILRNKNIVHADIKPGHILLNSEVNQLKLCGFDEAYYHLYSNNLSSHIGTVNYRSPELILGYSNGFSVDVWSAALVMYEMATCCILFSGETNHEILHRQINTLGNIPNNMIMHSRYKRDYFDDNSSTGTDPDNKLKYVCKDNSENDLKSLVFDAQKRRWGANINGNKLDLFCCLLKKMLILHPVHRLPIEYVYANPFFLKNHEAT